MKNQPAEQPMRTLAFLNNRLWRYGLASCLLVFAILWSGATPPPTDLASVQVTEAEAFCPPHGHSRLHNIGGERYFYGWTQLQGLQGGRFSCPAKLHARQVVVHWVRLSSGDKLELEYYEKRPGWIYSSSEVERQLANINADIDDTRDVWTVRLVALLLSVLLFMRRVW